MDLTETSEDREVFQTTCNHIPLIVRTQMWSDLSTKIISDSISPSFSWGHLYNGQRLWLLCRLQTTHWVLWIVCSTLQCCALLAVSNISSNSCYSHMYHAAQCPPLLFICCFTLCCNTYFKKAKTGIVKWWKGTSMWGALAALLLKHQWLILGGQKSFLLLLLLFSLSFNECAARCWPARVLIWTETQFFSVVVLK